MLKGFFWSGAGIGVLTIANLVKGKIYAVYLGTFGMGIFSQLMQFQVFFLSLVLFRISSGVVKNIAEYNTLGDKKALKEFVGVCNNWVLLVSSVACGILMLFAAQLSYLFLDSSDYGFFITMMLLSVIPAALVEIHRDYLRGLNELALLFYSSLSCAVISIIVTFFATCRFNLTGGIMAILLSSFGNILIVHLFFKNKIPEYASLPNPFKFKFSEFNHIKGLLEIGLCSTAMMLVSQAGLLISRTWLIKCHGVDANGLYQVAWFLNNQLIALIMSFAACYVFPKVCELKDNGPVNREINNALSLSAGLLLGLFLVVLFFRKLLIVLMLSREFLPVESFLALQFVGTFFMSLSQIISGPLILRSKASWVMGAAILSLVLILTSLFLIPKHGLLGIILSYSMASICLFVYYYYALWRSFCFELTSLNYILITLTPIILMAIFFETWKF